MTALAWLGIALLVLVGLSWPAGLALDRRADRHRTRARARVDAYLAGQHDGRLTAADTETLDALAIAQADALGRALDDATLYGRHAPTGQLPVSVEDRDLGQVWAYPPPVEPATPHDTALDAAVRRHPANYVRPRLADVVELEPRRPQ